MSAEKSFRELVVGETVIAVELDNEGLGIAFTSDWSLSVWSHISLTHHGQPVDPSRVSELVGSRVESLTSSPDRETLTFSSGLAVAVDLSNRVPEQPEAMMLRGPEQLIVVWNE